MASAPKDEEKTPNFSFFAKIDETAKKLFHSQDEQTQAMYGRRIDEYLQFTSSKNVSLSLFKVS